MSVLTENGFETVSEIAVLLEVLIEAVTGLLSDCLRWDLDRSGWLCYWPSIETVAVLATVLAFAMMRMDETDAQAPVKLLMSCLHWDFGCSEIYRSHRVRRVHHQDCC